MYIIYEIFSCPSGVHRHNATYTISGYTLIFKTMIWKYKNCNISEMLVEFFQESKCREGRWRRSTGGQEISLSHSHSVPCFIYMLLLLLLLLLIIYLQLFQCDRVFICSEWLIDRTACTYSYVHQDIMYTVYMHIQGLPYNQFRFAQNLAPDSRLRDITKLAGSLRTSSRFHGRYWRSDDLTFSFCTVTC